MNKVDDPMTQPFDSSLLSLLKGIGAAPDDMGDPDRWLRLVPGGNDPAKIPALKIEKEKLTLTEEQRDLAAPATTIEGRVIAIRREMKALGVDGVLVPRGDEFQGEYVPASSERLAFATGFTGSAGSAVILEEKAGFFTDGRYTIQAREQVPAPLFDVCSTAEGQSPTPTMTPSQWLEKNLTSGQKLGFDPWLHTVAEAKAIKAAADKAGAELVALAANPLDRAWSDRPALPLSPVAAHPDIYTGKPSAEKRAEIAGALKNHGARSCVLTLPEDIAWLLNIRGNDVPCTPFALSYAILHDTGKLDLFIDPRKLTPDAMAHLGPDVAVNDIGTMPAALEKLGRTGQGVLIDPARTPKAVETALASAGALIIEGTDPCQLPKALKNPVEQAGMIAAHVRDGAALTRFLARLDDPAETARLDEISGAGMLRSFRAENDKFRGLSFDTIAGAGGNGAIVHYRSTPKSNRPLTSGPVFLLDSGAQYLDGTTDVTRAVAVGTPTPEIRENFTRVLIGHIRLAKHVFPKGTTGDILDALARSSLKEAGLDYAHGTGHGVGCHLSVHEGPCGISPMAKKVPLMAGMVISNEPGYYKTGEYGIRIENLVLVEDAGNDQLKFRTLTLAPIDRKLIEPSLMSDDELKWLNDYHAEVRQKLKPLLDKKDPKAAAFLEKATEPVHRPPPAVRKTKMFTL